MANILSRQAMIDRPLFVIGVQHRELGTITTDDQPMMGIGIFKWLNIFFTPGL